MNGKLVLAIYMTDQGPRLENKMDTRFALRVLNGVCEDMRETIAADIAAALLDAQKRIEPVGG